MELVNVDCVDCFDRGLRQLYPHALPVNTVGHMVHSIIGYLGSGRRIVRLRIFAGGTPGQQGLGSDPVLSPGPDSDIHCSIVNGSGYLANQSILALLTDYFVNASTGAVWSWPPAPHQRRAGGWVELHGSDVGASTEGMMLLKLLAKLWKVNVMAGTGGQVFGSPGFAGFEGYYMVAHPDGTRDTKVGRRVTGLTVAP